MVKNAMVTKHNNLIEARYNLNLNEQKIILYAVSKLDSVHQKDFNIIEISIDEFTELLGTTKERYSEVKKVGEGLVGKVVKIKTDEDELTASWLSSMKYIKKTGIIKLEFSQQLKPYLLQLKNCYKSYKLENVIHLKNKYAIRIYELLKQYEKLRERIIKLDELKKMVGCENKYDRFTNFEDFVLKPSRSELLKHSDLCFEYEKIKEGRNIVAIKFIFEKNHSNIEKQTDVEYMIENGHLDEYITNIRKDMPFLAMEFFSNKQMNELYEIACEKCENNPYKYIEMNYYHIKLRETKTTVFSHLKNALEEGYVRV